ncbi:MAG: hypothetical protein V1826_01850, partial [bacterium]
IGDYRRLVARCDFAPTSRQLESANRLIEHLSALATLRGDFRYFLFADEHRFFLELAPADPDFVLSKQIATAARALTVLGPAVSVDKQFAYCEMLFGAGHGAIVGVEQRAELLLADNVPEDPVIALVEVANQLVGKGGRGLVLAASGFDAKAAFDQAFPKTQAIGGVIESYDTVGNLTLVPRLATSRPQFVLVGHYAWLHQLHWYANEFETIILGKVPFEASSRAQFRALGDAEGGFTNYLLARAILKLKGALHRARQLGKPVALADARLTTRDYASAVLNSLAGWQIVRVGFDDILG